VAPSNPPVWTTGGPRTLAATGCRSLDVLWLYELADINPRRSTHLAALRTLGHSLANHRVVPWNCWHRVPKHIRNTHFDLIVLDHNLLAIRVREDFPLRRGWLDWVSETNAIRVAMPQDEYLWTAILEEWLHDLDVQVIFSAFGPEHANRLYPSLCGRVAFEHSFTGYLYDSLLGYGPGVIRPHADRSLDVVYRARQLPFSLGARAQLKHSIGLAGRQAAAAAGLRYDIATGDQATVYGGAWFEFVASSRAILGTESGAGAIDGRGDIARAEKEMRATQPELSFQEFASAMPDGWDGASLFTIGPRHLEAAAAKTCQILVEGSYGGVLEPNVHYIPVDEHMERLPEAMERIRDPAESQLVAERAYRDIVLSGRYSYGALASQIERAVMPLVAPSSRTGRAHSWRALRMGSASWDRIAIRAPRFVYRTLERHARPALRALLALRRVGRRRG
jgi:hypothetical protein